MPRDEAWVWVARWGRGRLVASRWGGLSGCGSVARKAGAKDAQERVGWGLAFSPCLPPLFLSTGCIQQQTGAHPFILMTVHQHRAGLSLPGDVLDRTKEAAQGELVGMRGQ